MKILFVEEFDPAGVCLGHRDVLRARGIDACRPRTCLHAATPRCGLAVARCRWARHYRDAGWTLATSTIDYAVELDAAYLPPIVTVPSLARNCHTPEMIRLARCLAIPMRVGTYYACGLAATCGLNADYETRFKAERLGSLADAGLVASWADLSDALATWRDNPKLHREAQRARVT